MNRKIQATDQELILARYRLSPHAFNARTEALTFGVCLKTIYNVIARAGLTMKRGRKPLIPPQGPPLLSALPPSNSPSSLAKAERNRETALGLRDVLNAADPLDRPDTSNPPNFSDPTVEAWRERRGPPAIHPTKPPKPPPSRPPEQTPNKMPE